MNRLLRRPSHGVLWLLALAMSLATAAAKGLQAPEWVWIVAGCAAIACGLVALGLHLLPAPAAPEFDARDLALSLAAELEKASDTVGAAPQEGQWWLPSEAPSESVWRAREGELRAFGGRFHKPVRDAYRKVAQLNRKAAHVEETEYQAVGRVVDEVGHELSSADRDTLKATHGVIAHALERLSELESRATGGDERVVTDEHRSALRGALNEAQRVVEAGTARPDGDHLMHEMFAAHFAELDERLAEWDRAVSRNVSAPGRLKTAIEAKLTMQGLNEAPYQAPTIVDGFAVVTAERSLAGRLADPLPPAFDDPVALWRGWASDHPMAGMVDFNPAVTTVRGNVIYMEREEYPAGEFAIRARDLLAPLHEVLADAQGWPEARKIHESREALRAYPRAELIEDLKKAQLKPNIPFANGCHGCG